MFAPFSFVSHEIKATPDKASGPGWNAAITGCHEVSYYLTIVTAGVSF